MDGPQKNHTTQITRTIGFGDAAAKRLPIGSELLLSKDRTNGNQYGVIARWYMPGIATLFIILLVLVVVIGAWRGITSVFGLAISVAMLAVFVVPRIVNGHNAFLTCIVGAILIAFVSLYIAHGFTKRTTVAFIASLITLLLIVGLTAFASRITGTSEIIDEANIGLLYAKHPIDLAGLLTGGVVIASLGVLFDITTGQAATIDEIHEANRKLSMSRLFWKGMSVGREHVAALINTLALVYVGVALPAIVTTIVLNQQANYHAPLLVNLNTEIVAEEVMRTCVASIAMLLAMPLTTWLAAYILPRWTPAVDKKIKQWLKNL
ncbi:MAG: YibE/F family protein [Candidatus Saccharimonadales bacterium]